MNAATAQAIRLGIMGVQALVRLGLTAQRVSEIATEAEKNGGEVSDATVSRVENEAQAVNEAWDNA